MESTGTPSVLGPMDRAVLAALSIGAGAIHLAMVPIHAAEWMTEAVGFAIVGWLQIVLGVGLLVRPSRRVLAAAMALSGMALAAWVLSRTAGFPIGPHAGTAEDVGGVDLLTASFEGLLLAIGALSFARPKPAVSTRSSRWLALGAPPVLLVMVLTSVALASPSANHHGHGEDSAHDDVHADGATSESHGHGEGEEASGAAAENALDEFGLSESDHSHGHGSGVVPNVPIDDATRDALAAQLVVARDVALRHPTVADAEASGYRMVTTYLPLIGAHYIRFDLMDGTFDVNEPEMLLYDGIGPDAEIVGLSYYVVSRSGEPDGFAGPNDHWHQHIGLCIRSGVVVGGEQLTEAQCTASGGVKVDGTDGWMVHAWVVAGWESQQGVFSAENVDLR